MVEWWQKVRRDPLLLSPRRINLHSFTRALILFPIHSVRPNFICSASLAEATKPPLDGVPLECH